MRQRFVAEPGGVEVEHDRRGVGVREGGRLALVEGLPVRDRAVPGGLRGFLGIEQVEPFGAERGDEGLEQSEYVVLGSRFEHDPDVEVLRSRHRRVRRTAEDGQDPHLVATTQPVQLRVRQLAERLQRHPNLLHAVDATPRVLAEPWNR